MTDKVAQAIAEISAKLDRIEAMVAELTGKSAAAQASETERDEGNGIPVGSLEDARWLIGVYAKRTTEAASEYRRACDGDSIVEQFARKGDFDDEVSAMKRVLRDYGERLGHDVVRDEVFNAHKKMLENGECDRRDSVSAYWAVTA